MLSSLRNTTASLYNVFSQHKTQEENDSVSSSIQLHWDGFSIKTEKIGFSARISNIPKNLYHNYEVCKKTAKYLAVCSGLLSYKAEATIPSFDNSAMYFSANDTNYWLLAGRSLTKHYQDLVDKHYQDLVDALDKGACGVFTNVSTRSLHYDFMQDWSYPKFILQRGAGQSVLIYTEECLKALIQKTHDAVRQNLIEMDVLYVGLATFGVAIGAVGIYCWRKRRSIQRQRDVDQPLLADESISVPDENILATDESNPLSLQANTIFKPDINNAKTLADQLAANDIDPTDANTDIPNYLICPITKEIMTESVFANDGYSYEKVALQNHLATNKVSPVNHQLKINHYKDNVQLQNEAKAFVNNKIKEKSSKRMANPV